mgnify:CR=1 FL=1
MMLYTLKFTHYSPKDGKTGILGYFLVDDFEKFWKYLDKECFYDSFKDYEDDGDEGSYYPDDEWKEEHPQKMQEAKDLGLNIGEYGEISGPKQTMIRWFEGNGFEDVEDAYYGVTQYDWSEKRSIDDEHVELLIQLGVATII